MSRKATIIGAAIAAIGAMGWGIYKSLTTEKVVPVKFDLDWEDQSETMDNAANTTDDSESGKE